MRCPPIWAPGSERNDHLGRPAARQTTRRRQGSHPLRLVCVCLGHTLIVRSLQARASPFGLAVAPLPFSCVYRKIASASSLTRAAAPKSRHLEIDGAALNSGPRRALFPAAEELLMRLRVAWAEGWVLDCCVMRAFEVTPEVNQTVLDALNLSRLRSVQGEH